MIQKMHIEPHSHLGNFAKDVIFGMSDGLTVPFAIAAGLASATVSTKVIITAVLAEIAAGSISMGLGGFLAAKTEADYYSSERAFLISIVITFFALVIFGYLRGIYMTTRPFRSMMQTVAVGGFAAVAAFVLAKMLS